MGLYDMFFDLTRLEIHLWDRIDSALRAEIGVPLGRFEAMLIMRRLGTCRVLDVSRELSVTVGGTSKLIDRIEATGLCVRTANPDDRRSSLITLTERAQGVLERGETVIESVLQETLGEHLTEGEIRSLRQQLRALRHASDPLIPVHSDNLA
jgi:DNA-binding MarR family transcriptional regulator